MLESPAAMSSWSYEGAGPWQEPLEELVMAGFTLPVACGSAARVPRARVSRDPELRLRPSLSQTAKPFRIGIPPEHTTCPLGP